MELLIFVKHGYTKEYYPENTEDNWLVLPDTRDREIAKINTKLIPSIEKAIAIDRLDQKIAACIRKNDILEVHEDGWWDNVVMKNPKNKMQDSYGVVRIPGVPDESYEQKVIANKDKVDQRIEFKRRYSIPDGIVQLGKVVSLPSVSITDKGAALLQR